MATITPTATALQWGPRVWQRYDYLAHPTRDAGGNPLLIHRHGGGGISGSYKGLWDSSQAPGLYHFVRYLQGLDATGTRDVHWDVVSVSTGQVLFDVASGIPRCSRLMMPAQIHDLQLCHSSLKALSTDISQGVGGTFAVDPTKFAEIGNSHGASQALNASLAPPVYGRGNVRSFMAHIDEHWYRDSYVRTVINFAGQIDIRTIGGVDQIYFPLLEGWMGTRPESSAQWDALSSKMKEALSALHKIQTGDHDHYAPIFNLYNDGGNHIHPYGDPGTGGGADAHDSQQLTDLSDALAQRGLLHDKLLMNSGDWAYHVPGDADAPSIAISSALYAWMNARVEA